MINQIFISTVLFAIVLLPTYAATWSSKPWCPKYSGRIFQDTAHNSKGLKHIVQKYRDGLGGIDNGNGPGQKKGQRSINWDADVVPFDMPGNFFKNTVTRGAEFFAKGGKFAVSNPPNDGYSFFDNRFSSFNPIFPKLFITFSPKRLFTPVKINIVTTKFTVPQTHDEALVSGFGAVFTNVVLKGKTVINFYDKNNCLIISLPILPKAKGLSFGGIIVDKKDGKKIAAAVAKVKITLGTGIISQSWKKYKNFVVLDDLIYGEPQGIAKKGYSGITTF